MFLALKEFTLKKSVWKLSGALRNKSQWVDLTRVCSKENKKGRFWSNFPCCLGKKKKEMTRAQTLLPNTPTQHFSHTLSPSCHLSPALSVWHISSWCGKGIANTPGECFLLFGGSGCQMKGFFIFFCLSLSPWQIWVWQFCPRSVKVTGQKFWSS